MRFPNAGHGGCYYALKPSAVFLIGGTNGIKLRLCCGCQCIHANGSGILDGIHSRSPDLAYTAILEFLRYSRQFAAGQLINECQAECVCSLYRFHGCRCCALDSAAVFLIGGTYSAELFLRCGFQRVHACVPCGFDTGSNGVNAVAESFAMVIQQNKSSNQSSNSRHDPSYWAGQHRNGYTCDFGTGTCQLEG